MKKILSLLLALLLVAGLMACGGGNDPSPPPDAPPTVPVPPDSENMPDWDTNNDDLMSPELGHDFGLGPVGHDMETLVERMGADFVADLRIGISVNAQTTSWQIDWVDEFRSMGNRFGFDVVVLTSDDDPVQQAADFRSFQSQQVDGIIGFVTFGEAMATTMTEINAAGIPVVNAVEVAEGTEIAGFVNVSQRSKGVMMAEQVSAAAEAAGEDAYVLVLCLSFDVPTLTERRYGFIERAEELGNVHIIDVRTSDSDDGLLNVALESLLVNEEVNTVFSTFLNPTFSAIAAGDQLGLDLNIYGIDADEGALELLKEGRISGLHPQFARANASLSMFVLLRAINGDQFPMEVWEPDNYALGFATPENAALFLHMFYGR